MKDSDKAKAFDALMELAKDPELLISLAKTGEKAREAVERLKQELAPKPQFYAGQPVLVRDYDKDDWVPVHLLGIRDDEHGYIYRASDKGNYKQCRPHPDAVSLPDWIKHNGDSDMPIMDDVWVDVVFTDERRGSGRADNFDWVSVASYTITPLPEFL